ncbi:MAG: ribose 5-phosphate isomerase A [Proteobacteria bacterium]|jgi:ribose 5-phosphate isomerase A|nr:ribose 5-phosphate isomerase A [Pseudomonadota bacterium]
MNDKELVANAALDYVKDKMIVGLGTGTTANYFIDALAKKIKSEKLTISVVASSTVSQERGNQAGINYISIDQVESIDLYVDGADEITEDLVLLKGRGYDLIKEKLLAASSKKFIVIGDKSKIVAKIGEKFSIPIEITPIAWKITKRIFEKMSEECILRQNTAGDAYAITSYGNLVLDCRFKYDDIHELSKMISEVPGVFEHGIFLSLSDIAIIADNGKIRTITTNC